MNFLAALVVVAGLGPENPLLPFGPRTLVYGDSTSAVVASDGTNFLVVWRDDRFQVDQTLVASRVSAAGLVLDPDGIIVGSPFGSHPSVAFAAGRYVITWELNGRIYARWMTAASGVWDAPSGSVAGPVELARGDCVSMAVSPTALAVAYRGGGQLVIREFTHAAAPIGTAVALAGGTVSRSSFTDHCAELTVSPNGYEATWTEDGVQRGASILGPMVTPAVHGDAGAATMPVGVFAMPGGPFVRVWGDDSGPRPVIWGASVGPGPRFVATGFKPSLSLNSGRLSVMISDSNYYGTYRAGFMPVDGGSPTVSAISSSGAGVQHTFAPGSGTVLAAFSGPVRTTTFTSELQESDGGLRDVAQTASAHHDLKIAAGPTNFLVIATTTDDLYHRTLKATRIGLDGRPLDEAPLVLSTTSEPPVSKGVAFAGGVFWGGLGDLRRQGAVPHGEPDHWCVESHRRPRSARSRLRADDERHQLRSDCQGARAAGCGVPARYRCRLRLLRRRHRPGDASRRALAHQADWHRREPAALAERSRGGHHDALLVDRLPGVDGHLRRDDHPRWRLARSALGRSHRARLLSADVDGLRWRAVPRCVGDLHRAHRVGVPPARSGHSHRRRCDAENRHRLGLHACPGWRAALVLR